MDPDPFFPGFPAHQDAPAFVQFGQSSHMTVMFTIDPTTDANGCLEVVPGSHKNTFDRGILPQEKHDGSISVDWCKQQQWLPVHCKPVSITWYRLSACRMNSFVAWFLRALC